MARKEVPIYKPGIIGKFFYYFIQIAGLFFLLFLTIATGFFVFFYIWSLIDASTVPMRLYESSLDGPWLDWKFHGEGISCALFLWLFIYGLRDSLIDFFSAKETAEFRITKKETEHISGTRSGYTGYFIYDRKDAFEVGAKNYEKLHVGNTVEVIYTKVQRNVRKIILVK